MSTTFKEYKAMMNTFKKREGEWQYLPDKCQNRLCCSDDPEPTVHGMVLWGGAYGPFIVCEDCAFQAKLGTYDDTKLISRLG